MKRKNIAPEEVLKSKGRMNNTSPGKISSLLGEEKLQV